MSITSKWSPSQVSCAGQCGETSYVAVAKWMCDGCTEGKRILDEMALRRSLAETEYLRVAAERARDAIQEREHNAALHGNREAAHAYREAARMVADALRGEEQ